MNKWRASAASPTWKTPSVEITTEDTEYTEIEIMSSLPHSGEE